MLKDLNLLGTEVEDKVTKFRGFVTCVSYDLYGCIQAIVTPPKKDDGTVPDGRWFDTKRLKVISGQAVMEVPIFEDQPGVKLEIPGPELKPEGRRNV